MTYSPNPTSMSAVIGEEIELGGGRGSRTALLKPLLMPLFLLTFAAYLGVGMITMRVPDGTAFPGPRFFPGLIAAGLVLFAVLLTVSAIREYRKTPALIVQETVIAGSASEGVGVGGAGAGAFETDANADHAAPRTVRVDWKSLSWVVGSFLVFALVLPYLGWIIAAGLLFWGVSRGFGAARSLTSLIVGLTLSSVVYIAFDMALGMSLPSGILGWEF